jgi:tetratricopeptide (TPR) repeat protein
MVQASLADALMYANLAIRLADESGSPRARFIHRVELAEILWHRGDTEQAIELLEWVNCASNIPFQEEDTDSEDNSIPPRKWAELYCLYRYRFGKVLVHRGEKGDMKKAQEMACEAIRNAEEEGWHLNIGLGYLLKGYIKLAQAKPKLLVSPTVSRPPSPNFCQDCEDGQSEFKKAKDKFEEIRAGHHELKARIGEILCTYVDTRNSQGTLKDLSEVASLAGERHLFRIDAEVEKAVVSKADNQIARAKSMCIATGYLRHIPILDSLSQ